MSHDQTSGGHPGFRQVLSEMLSMHVKKGADYGTGEDIFANIRASEEFGIPGWKGAVLRANDKMSRLKSFFVNGKLENESVTDSLLDLANYAVIALALYREENNQTEDSWPFDPVRTEGVPEYQGTGHHLSDR